MIQVFRYREDEKELVKRQHTAASATRPFEQLVLLIEYKAQTVSIRYAL